MSLFFCLTATFAEPVEVSGLFSILSDSCAEGYDSTTVKEEGLINASDKEIWDFAKINNLNIVTQDSDFNDLNTLYGFPPKII